MDVVEEEDVLNPDIVNFQKVLKELVILKKKKENKNV